MASTNINIRMDANLKQQFEAFCADVGMSMSTAFNIFARKAVREYRIPFEIGGSIPNAETLEAIGEVRKMKADLSLGKTYADVDQMMDDLLLDVKHKGNYKVPQGLETGKETWMGYFTAGRYNQKAGGRGSPAGKESRSSDQWSLYRLQRMPHQSGLAADL